ELRRPHTGLGRFTGGWFERLMDLLRFPFRVPVFALGTAAAVVVVVLLLIPMTDTFQRQPMITRDERPAKAKQQSERPTHPDALLRKDAASTEAKSDPASPTSMQEGDEKARRREHGPSGHEMNAVSGRRRSSEQGALRDRPLAAPPRRAEVEEEPPEAVAGALGSSDGDAGPKRASRQGYNELRFRGGPTPPPAPTQAPSAKAELPSSTPDSPQIRVRVVDEHGKDVSWIKPELPRLPAVLPAKGDLLDREKGGGVVLRRDFRGTVEKKEIAAYEIEVRVMERNGNYDIRTRLTESATDKAAAQMEEVGVPREEVESRVNGMVAAMMEGIRSDR
ncbi:MAG: hypothetical protein V2B18_21060, partial [Pseudomonadota bacterium]